MIEVIIVVAIIALISGTYYISSQNKNKTTATLSGGKEYKDDQYGFSFQYPSNYSIITDQELETFKRIQIKGSDENSCYSFQSVKGQSPYKNRTSANGQTIKTFDIAGHQAQTVSGNYDNKLDPETNPRPGQPYLFTYIQNGDNYLELDPCKPDSYLKIEYEKILSSFKFYSPIQVKPLDHYDINLTFKDNGDKLFTWCTYDPCSESLATTKGWYQLKNSSVLFRPKFNDDINKFKTIKELQDNFDFANLWIYFPDKKTTDDIEVPYYDADKVKERITFISYENGKLKGSITGKVVNIIHRNAHKNCISGDVGGPCITQEPIDKTFKIDFELPVSADIVKN